MLCIFGIFFFCTPALTWKVKANKNIGKAHFSFMVGLQQSESSLSSTFQIAGVILHDHKATPKLRSGLCQFCHHVKKTKKKRKKKKKRTSPGYTLVCQGADNRRLFRSPPPPPSLSLFLPLSLSFNFFVLFFIYFYAYFLKKKEKKKRLTAFPFEFRPRTFNIELRREKSISSEIMVLGCSCSLNCIHKIFNDDSISFFSFPIFYFDFWQNLSVRVCSFFPEAWGSFLYYTRYFNQYKSFIGGVVR